MNYGLGYLPGFSNSDIYITKDVEDLDIYAVYSGFQYFYIGSVELIGNRNFIKTIFPVFMLVLVLIDLLIVAVRRMLIDYKGNEVRDKEKVNREGSNNWYDRVIGRNNTLYRCFAVLLIGLLCSIPLLFKMGLLFDDGYFLYGRFNGIADGLKDGQFPVRIHPNTINGYGYAVSYFYPELFLYPFALLRCMGYSLRFVMYTMILAMNIGTAALSYYSVRRILNKDSIATFGAFLYSFSLYRLVDVYSRGAIAEVIAIMFLPLIVTGLYIVIVEAGSIIPLTVGLFGLVNSHILSCEIVLIFGILLCIVCPKQVFKKDCIIRILKSVGITFLLSAYFILPFLHMSTTDEFKVYAENAYETSNNMLSLTDLFSFTCYTNGIINNNSMFGTRYTLGIVIVISSIAMFLLAFVVNRKQKDSGAKENKHIWKFTQISFVFGVIALFLSSELFPWERIENVGGIIRTVFCMVQFPWRYLSVAMVFLMFSICGCLNIIVVGMGDADEVDIGISESSQNIETIQITNIRRRKNTEKKAVLCISHVILLLLFIQAGVYFSTLKNTADDKNLIFDGSYIRKYSCTGMGEYEPVLFNDEQIDYSIEELQYVCNENAVINPTGEAGNTGLTIGPLSKSGTNTTLLIINPTGENQTLYLPILYYYGYEISNVADDPSGLIPEMFESETGRMALNVPAGYYNGVHIEYKEPFLYRIAEFISLITLISILVYGIKHRIYKLKCDKI